MVKRPQETFHLSDEGLAALCATKQFSSLPKPDQEMLEEHLQTAFCGANRLDRKLLRFRLTRVRDSLGLRDKSEQWDQLKHEIEKVLSLQDI